MHVSGEKPPRSSGADADDDNNNADRRSDFGSGPECEEPSPLGRENKEQGGCGDGDEEGGPVGEAGGRWEPEFLEAELREMCLRQLEIPVLPVKR